MKNNNKYEKLLWSIALPGFGQLLNHQFLKGSLFIILEFLINVQANLNKAILFSFHGEVEKAIHVTNYQWLMFYPCVYLFVMWDAYKNAGGGGSPFAFLPFVFSAYFMTAGVIYSSKLTLFGRLLGPVWLPILSLIPGLLVGYILQMIFSHKRA